MAKKSSRAKKNKTRNPLQKLESKLNGYWKKQSWEEFITLYERQKEKAEKTSAAKLWDAAVYNLLLQVTFVDKNIARIQRAYAGLSKSDNLSSENVRCLEVLYVLINVYNGFGYPGLEEKCSDKLPAPFAALALKLKSLLQERKSTPLDDYLQDKLKRARKGEKHYARASWFLKSFERIVKKDSDIPLKDQCKQLDRAASELSKAASYNEGIPLKVLENVALLSKLCSDIFVKSYHSLQPEKAMIYLINKDFKYSGHPVETATANLMLWAGKQKLGSSWEISMRMLLQSYIPSVSIPMPHYLREQCDVMTDLRKQGVKSYSILYELIKHDVWTLREKIVLCIADIMVKKKYLSESILDLYDVFGFMIQQTKIQEIARYAGEQIVALTTLAKLVSDSGLNEKSILNNAVKFWHSNLGDYPLNNVDTELDILLKTVCSTSLSDRYLLSIIEKRAEGRALKKDKIKYIEQINDARGPLKLTSDEIDEVSNDLFYIIELESVFSAYKLCLDPADYRELVHVFVTKLFDITFEDDDVFDYDSSELSFYELDPSLLRKLADDVDSDFPLLGVLLFFGKVLKGNFKIPGKTANPEVLLLHPPPDKQFFMLLLNILEWKSSPYSNTFLKKVINHLAEYITINEKWRLLTSILKQRRLTALSSSLLEIWENRGFLHQKDISKDLQKAIEEVREILGAKQKKKSGAKKKVRKMKIRFLMD